MTKHGLRRCTRDRCTHACAWSTCAHAPNNHNRSHPSLSLATLCCSRLPDYQITSTCVCHKPTTPKLHMRTWPKLPSCQHTCSPPLPKNTSSPSPHFAVSSASACPSAASTAAASGAGAVDGPATLSFSSALPTIICAARRMPMRSGLESVSSKRCGVRT